MEFPRYIFKGRESKLIQAESEMETGWHWDVLSAMNEPAASTKQHEDSPPDDTPPTREELEAKAAELGIIFDRRIGNKKLSDMITKALEA